LLLLMPLTFFSASASDALFAIERFFRGMPLATIFFADYFHFDFLRFSLFSMPFSFSFFDIIRRFLLH
jgi:hypothetical protein